MIEILHGGMLVPASVSLCCAAVAPRASRVAGTVVSLAMLLAMADSMSLAPVIPAVVWAVVLILLALISSATASITIRRSVQPDSCAMSIHRGLGLILTSALLMLSEPASPGARGDHAHGGAGVTLSLLVVAGIVALAFSAVVTLRRGGDRNDARRRWPSRGALDVTSMSAATSLMGFAVLAG
jgi:hypothetical protein